MCKLLCEMHCKVQFVLNGVMTSRGYTAVHAAENSENPSHDIISQSTTVL